MLARLLCSLSALLLALPQGWCCWIACCAQKPTESTTLQAPTPQTCCCCAAAPTTDGCESVTAETTPTGRSPFQPGNCPCCVVNALKLVPTGFVPELQLVLLSPLLLADLPLTERAHDSLSSAPAAVADPPLFLLHCVSRC